MASTCRLQGTPPHTHAHLQKNFGTDRSTFFFRGVSSPGASWPASPRFVSSNLGRPYLLHPLRRGPAVFSSEVGNMSPSPPREGGPLPRV